MRHKKVLITGGAGFIGSYVADLLLKQGDSVRILDNLKLQVHADEPKRKDGWPAYLNPECEVVKGDVTNPDAIKKSLRGITHIIHLAAGVGVGQSMYEIIDYTHTNALGTAVLLEELTHGRHEVERIAVASSMSIYGEGAYRTKNGKKVFPGLRSRPHLESHKWELHMDKTVLSPIPTDESKPLSPASIYAIGKRDQEEMCIVVGKSIKIPTIALRLFNTYGPRQALSNPYTGAAAIFISRLMNNEAPLIFEDGKQLRDFVSVNDVARAFTTVINSDKQVWDAYNVGSGQKITILEIATILTKLLHKSIHPQVLQKYRMGDIRHCFADTKKLKKDFGFKATVSLEEGMDELINWVANQKAVDKTMSNVKELKRNKLIL